MIFVYCAAWESLFFSLKCAVTIHKEMGLITCPEYVFSPIKQGPLPCVAAV